LLSFKSSLQSKQASGWIEFQLGRLLAAHEIEYASQASSLHIGGTIADRRKTPIGFDELEDRRLIGSDVIDVVQP